MRTHRRTRLSCNPGLPEGRGPASRPRPSWGRDPALDRGCTARRRPLGVNGDRRALARKTLCRIGRLSGCDRRTCDACASSAGSRQTARTSPAAPKLAPNGSPARHIRKFTGIWTGNECLARDQVSGSAAPCRHIALDGSIRCRWFAQRDRDSEATFRWSQGRHDGRAPRHAVLAA